MARSFTIRVLLHDYATAEEYELLRERLLRIGVYDEIQGDNGLWYKLPPAEYTSNTDVAPETMRAAVVSIASNIKPRVAVLLSDCFARYWEGLERIPPPPRALAALGL